MASTAWEFCIGCVGGSTSPSPRIARRSSAATSSRMYGTTTPTYASISGCTTRRGAASSARHGCCASPNSAPVEAAFVWVAEGAAPPAPKALADSVSSPAPWERLLILAMAGERPSGAAVSAVDSEQAGYIAPTTDLYGIVSGRFRTLDVASLFVAAGAQDRAAPLLDQAERTLNDYEQRGVTAPAFSFHRARVLALRGDTARALTSLQSAVDRGWRRAWWVRRDPALERLRGESAFSAILQKMDAQLAVQRKNAGS